MSEKNLIMTLFFTILLSTMVMTSVVAQSRIVGVNVGDWFKYGEVSGSWSSDDPNAIFPSLEFNYTDWMLISVEDISGTNITFQSTWHFTNGTEKIETGHIDIDTGEGNMTLSAISANLSPNDPIYSSPGYSTQKINGTIIRTYPDGVRDTNYMNITTEINQTGLYQYISMTWYWDKSSGMFVEMAQDVESQIENYTTSWSLLLRITESNVWVIPEFPSVIILPIFVTATLIVAIIYRKKHPM